MFVWINGFARCDSWNGSTVFLFFSNRAGCGLSLLVSLVVTLVLFVACGGAHLIGH